MLVWKGEVSLHRIGSLAKGVAEVGLLCFLQRPYSVLKLTLALSGSNYCKGSHSRVEIGFPLTAPIMGILM